MKKRGFTLIELMLALSIFAILMGAVYKAYFSEMKELRQITDKNNLQYSAKTCIEYITRELRNIEDETQEIELIGNEIIIKSFETKKDVVLVDITGNKSGLVNLNKATRKLVDQKGRILCNGVNNISLKKDESGDVIVITIVLQSGNETHSVTTGININR